MLKSVTALSAALILGAALVGSATTASAKDRGYGGSGCCGPIKPTTSYSTKKTYKNVKVYKDVWKNKYVKRIKLQHAYHSHPADHPHSQGNTPPYQNRRRGGSCPQTQVGVSAGQEIRDDQPRPSQAGVCLRWRRLRQILIDVSMPKTCGSTLAAARLCGRAY